MRIAALNRNLDDLRKLALQAHSRMPEEASSIRQELMTVRDEVQHVHASLKEYDVLIAIDGAPQAATGIRLAALGLVVQAIGSALPQW